MDNHKIKWLFLHKNYKSVIKLTEAELENYPRNDYAWGYQGASLCMLNQFREAVDCLDMAIKIAPRRYEYWYYKASALHELGHSCGLKHCIDPDCVMRSSTYVEDVDQKGIQYCQTCRETLQQLD